MIAIDTNVVVRFLVNDDREQARRARALIDGEDVFVATTVLLETESVLRSAYRLSRQGLFDALRAFLDLPRVSAQDREGAGRHSTGPNKAWTFADALHLASAAGCVAFASFDRGLKQTAAKLGAPAVRAP